jgi:hypothetical protein
MKGKIFNGQEVQAIIAGNKTQFREVIKEIGNIKLNSGCAGLYFGKCPYQVGQEIFCKESFAYDYDGKVFYKAGSLAYKWKPAQHMKQEHSRLTLQIKEIRVERLADISEDDAYKEGVQITDEWTGCAYDLDFTDAFKFNWNATHKKPKEKFEASPWCWIVSFEVINN